MDFEKIKQQMDTHNTHKNQIPSSVKGIRKSKMPIQKVRINMISEIVIQLVLIVIFLTIPTLISLGSKEMYTAPLSMYYITMFVTCLITIGYLIKLSFFLFKTKNINGNSKETILAFTHELKLTLEVYKTAVISGSFLLVIAVFFLLSSFKGVIISGQEAIHTFNDILALNLSSKKIITYIITYLIISTVIYLGTVSWTNKLYGAHVKNLEKTLKEFDTE